MNEVSRIVIVHKDPTVYEWVVFSHIRRTFALTKSHLEIFKYINERVDGTGHIELKHQDIQAETGISRQVVAKALDKLCACGVLVKAESRSIYAYAGGLFPVRDKFRIEYQLKKD